MKRYSILLATIALIAAFIACEKDGIEGTVSSVKRTVSVSYSLPDEVSTYGFSPTTNEQTISNLCLLFIKDNRCIGAVNGVPNASTLTFELPASVKVGEQYDIIVLANPDSYVKHINNLGLYWTATIAKLVGTNLNGSAMAYLGNSLAANPQLMVAQASGVRLSYANTLDLGTLIRVFARVDIDATLVTGGGATFDGAYLDNQAAAAPLFAGWSYAASSTSPGGMVAATGNKIEGALYLLPTKAEPDKPFIIAEFTISGSKKYYKIPLCPSGLQEFPIKSNYYYKIDITSRSGSGGATRDAASSSISYYLNGWENSFGGKVVRNPDGSKMLSVGSGTIVLYGLTNAKGSTIVGLSGTSATVTASSSAGWLSASIDGNKLTVTATSNNTDKVSREATVTLAADGLSLPVKVVQTTPWNRNLSVTITDNSKLVFEPNGGSYNGITVTTMNGAKWKTTTDQPWITANNSGVFTGSSGGTLTVTVANMNSTPSSEQRSGKVTVTTDEGSEWSFTVVQKLYHMLDVRKGLDALTPADLQFVCDGEVKTFSVTNERTDWGVTSSDDINFAVSKTSNTSFTITAKRQDVFGAAARSADIKVDGKNGKSITFKVTQEPVVVASNDEAVLEPNSNIYWYNRNVGATSSMYFSNFTSFPAASSVANAKGDYVAHASAAALCPSGYRLPNTTEATNIVLKTHDVTPAGSHVAYFDGTTREGLKRRIFFPYAGRQDPSGEAIGYYTTSTPGTALMIIGGVKTVPSGIVGNLSVRCVQGSGSAVATTIATKTISPTGSPISVEIGPPDLWTAVSDNSAFYIAKANNALVISATQNSNPNAPRIGKVTVTRKDGGTTGTTEFNVIQQFDGGTITLDAHWDVGSKVLPASGGVFKLEVETASQGWLKVSKNNGRYNGIYSPTYTGWTADQKADISKTGLANSATFFAHAEENIGTADRTGLVFVKDASDNIIGRYNVIQSCITRIGKFGDGDGGDPYATMLGVESVEENEPKTWGPSTSSPFTEVRKGLTAVKNNIGVVASYPAIDECVKKNLDTDNDGVIESNEIRWYLPAKEQLLGVYVAMSSLKNSLSITAYWSASHRDDNSSWYGNYWGFSGVTSKTGEWSVRCVRDL